MRILLISQYFTPEITAAPLRLSPFAAGLARLGHEVEVICEVPSHPQGVIYEGFSARPLQRRSLDGSAVSYVWAWPARSKSALSRLAAYGSYAATATLAGLFAARPDVILASSPPLSVGAVGSLLSRRHRAPWVLDVRDLWPQVAGELGKVSSSRALAAATALEHRLYRDAAAVLTTTEPFKAHIGRFTELSKVTVIPNGTTRDWMAMGETEVDPAAVGLDPGRFVWTYAGNVGLSQGLDVAVEAAQRLGPSFQLLILGDGASRSGLRRAAAAAPEGSVVFRDPLPPSEASRVMRASDALLVSLADKPALGKTVPVKLYDSAALGRPIVVAAPGEPRRLAEQTGAAMTVPPGDAGALAEAVRRLREEEALRRRLSEAARQFAAANLREDGVKRLEAVLSAARGAPA
jgi:colanic acid biosynthesis glycosyl transferase WcaI